MPEKTVIVKLNARNQKTADQLKQILASAPGFAVAANGRPDCDVLFMEVGYDLDEEFKLLEQVRTGGLARVIFVTSSRKDPDVLLKTLKAGVSQFFTQPLSSGEILDSLKKFKRNVKTEIPAPNTEKKGTLVNVIGSKGGVGATTTAVNLAVSLKQAAGEKLVALADMNSFFGGVHFHLDIKATFSWVEAAGDIERMDSTYLLNALSRHSSGIHVLPAPSRLSGQDAATPQAAELLFGLMRTAFDIVVVDHAKGLDDLTLKMLALPGSIIMVTELNLVSLLNAKKVLDTLDRLGFSYGKDVKVVVNRYEKKSLISAEEAEKTLARKIALKIPNDYETILSAINTGRPLADAAPKALLTETYGELAALLLNRDVSKKEKSPFAFVMKNFKDLALHVHKGTSNRWS